MRTVHSGTIDLEADIFAFFEFVQMAAVAKHLTFSIWLVFRGSVAGHNRGAQGSIKWTGKKELKVVERFHERIANKR